MRCDQNPDQNSDLYIYRLLLKKNDVDPIPDLFKRVAGLVDSSLNDKNFSTNPIKSKEIKNMKSSAENDLKNNPISALDSIIKSYVHVLVYTKKPSDETPTKVQESINSTRIIQITKNMSDMYALTNDTAHIIEQVKNWKDNIFTQPVFNLSNIDPKDELVSNWNELIILSKIMFHAIELCNMPKSPNNKFNRDEFIPSFDDVTPLLHIQNNNFTNIFEKVEKNIKDVRNGIFEDFKKLEKRINETISQLLVFCDAEYPKNFTQSVTKAKQLNKTLSFIGPFFNSTFQSSIKDLKCSRLIRFLDYTDFVRKNFDSFNAAYKEEFSKIVETAALLLDSSDLKPHPQNDDTAKDDFSKLKPKVENLSLHANGYGSIFKNLSQTTPPIPIMQTYISNISSLIANLERISKDLETKYATDMTGYHNSLNLYARERNIARDLTDLMSTKDSYAKFNGSEYPNSLIEKSKELEGILDKISKFKNSFSTNIKALIETSEKTFNEEENKLPKIFDEAFSTLFKQMEKNIKNAVDHKNLNLLDLENLSRFLNMKVEELSLAEASFLKLSSAIVPMEKIITQCKHVVPTKKIQDLAANFKNCNQTAVLSDLLVLDTSYAILSSAEYQLRWVYEVISFPSNVANAISSDPQKLPEITHYTDILNLIKDHEKLQSNLTSSIKKAFDLLENFKVKNDPNSVPNHFTFSFSKITFFFNIELFLGLIIILSLLGLIHHNRRQHMVGITYGIYQSFIFLHSFVIFPLFYIGASISAAYILWIIFGNNGNGDRKNTHSSRYKESNMHSLSYFQSVNNNAIDKNPDPANQNIASPEANSASAWHFGRFEAFSAAISLLLLVVA
ncbi:hypothetical protein DI09_21p190 [Mitosporidium daphniae]|uniref:Uncharacterized protein n=1 Tax=Mitosporidium daphniae TaxID=1485682 RepID=A0A098VSS5_9MICR|nr:uncharacterized protein DI09_21p190 [Mitosporidium daphniae]KGG52047.1 hypothetical protein DI09_21p190 [Mitosporidium daphniae]|eukprot:XP_013238474.1 uncharacterized protein DI09_21p190 [Mitosporidium daphniae]